MNVAFSPDSDVSVALTCCNRLDLLTRTLESFFACNTYPLRRFIIIEDSGKVSAGEVAACVPGQFADDVTIIINNPQLGQLKAIDKAYQTVDTDYIFHCEEDWLFYRPRFIEESKRILEMLPDIFSVWLRDYHYDMAHFSFSRKALYRREDERLLCGHIPYYRVYSRQEHNQCFSFNPGLRRRADYPAGGYLANGINDEGAGSQYYEARGMHSVMLENSAVLHIGYGYHIIPPHLRRKKRIKKALFCALTIAVFALGVALGRML